MAASGASPKIEGLRRWFAATPSVLVAYSGGVDSTLVAAVAGHILGDRALAVTAVSPSLPPGQMAEARRVADDLGLRHRTVETRETERPEYLANGLDRCYHCRLELYRVLRRIADEDGLQLVVSGTNLDDLDDFRPGLRAAAEAGVRHPLVEVGFSKRDVRVAARELDIPTWDKPASACLSSRIPFGQRISVDELERIGRAERLLTDLGFRRCRARVHGDLVRVEVDLEDLPRFARPDVRERVVEALKALGYRFVTLDLEGFRSGSMNPSEASS
jgi:uncharacterized protein